MLSHSTIGEFESRLVRRNQKQQPTAMVMGGSGRQFTPRVRPIRSLGEPRTPNSPPQSSIEAPQFVDGKWQLELPLAQRLYQKSGIGLFQQSKYTINHFELVFCFWYRHVPLPESFHFEDLIEKHPSLSYEIVIYDVLRNGGNILVPQENLHDREFVLPENTWGAYWDRSMKWQSDVPLGALRWVHSSDIIDWKNLIAWANLCFELGFEALLVVIDGEMDVTSYKIEQLNPIGSHASIHSLDEDSKSEVQQQIKHLRRTREGWYLPSQIHAWPLPSFGVSQLSGLFFSNEEVEFLQESADVEKTGKKSLYADLVMRGLMLRPGFKFGCCWRAYSAPMEDEHAPYLIPDIEFLPYNFESLCLSLRLSEGVNKAWAYPYLHADEEWKYMTISRWNSS
jgi:hypothetical protein